MRVSMRALPCLVSAILCASCADETVVKVKVAEGFTPGRAQVSVLGVFRDGRMSVDAWGPLALPISAALGASEVCEPAFSARLQRDNEPLFASIDEQAKNDGITEDLLSRLAPNAQGELILAITMHGSVGGQGTDKSDKSQATRSPPPQSQGMPPMRGMGARGGGGMGAHREPSPRSPPPRVLELSASLFSVKQRQPLARMTLTYAGSSADDAVRQFSAELGKLIPGSACKGWVWQGRELPPSVAPLLEGP